LPRRGDFDNVEDGGHAPGDTLRGKARYEVPERLVTEVRDLGFCLAQHRTDFGA
jgi:hypothetical protein